jgi:hypothetical protein
MVDGRCETSLKKKDNRAVSTTVEKGHGMVYCLQFKLICVLDR